MDKQDATRDFTFAKLSDLTLPVTFRMQVSCVTIQDRHKANRRDDSFA